MVNEKAVPQRSPNFKIHGDSVGESFSHSPYNLRLVKKVRVGCRDFTRVVSTVLNLEYAKSDRNCQNRRTRQLGKMGAQPKRLVQVVERI